MTVNPTSSPIVVCALYHFVMLEDFAELREPLLTLMGTHGLRGTLLLAHEGINGTVAGSRRGIDALLAYLEADGRFGGLQAKESYDDELPFYRAKVKLKKEIVTMGITDLDPNKDKGEYVSPENWNALISDPQVTVIDTRNAYEVAIGTFAGAINPDTTSFRQFPEYAAEHLDKTRNKKVAMFCTGGIRCEKSTAYLKSQGFDEVYHLEGGILKYLEKVPEPESLWQGECFVFDNRVTVNHNLEKGEYDQCHACRMPIDADTKQHSAYVPGISCPHCIDKVDENRRQRFAERQHQLQLAQARGDAHLGEDALAAQQRNRAAKQAERARQRRRQQG